MTQQTDIFNNIITYRPYPKRINQSLYVLVRVASEQLIEQHSGEAYFLTVGLGKTQSLSIEKEWELFGQMLEETINQIMETLMIAGIVVGIEMYSKNQNRPNTKALRPHAHMVIFSYNNFLNFPIHEIEEYLISSGFDFKVDKLKDAQDMAKTTCYTVKSAKQKILNQATEHFYRTPPVALAINAKILNNPMKNLAAAFQNNEIPHKSYSILHPQKQYPSVSRFNGDQKLQISEFLNKLCHQQKIGFYKKRLMTVLEPAQYTWADCGPVEQFIEKITDHASMPDTYRQALYNNAAWILSEGSLGKTNFPIQIVFPRIKIFPNLWEFKNKGVYNFSLGTFEEKLPSPFSSCSKFIETPFSQLPYPKNLIAFLVKIIPKPDENDNLENFMRLLGSTFHPVPDRKQQKAVWIYGDSGTFKTWFIKNFLESNFNELLINRVESGATQFQYGRLRGETEGILFIDEFRSMEFSQPAKFLQIIDGQKTLLAEKYKKAEISQFKGQALLTTNQKICHTHYEFYDQEAFAARFKQIQFEISDGDLSGLQEILSLIQEDEWYSLGILCNTLFLENKYGRISIFPKNWGHPKIIKISDENYSVLENQNVKIQPQQEKNETFSNKKEPFSNKKELFSNKKEHFSNKKEHFSNKNEKISSKWENTWKFSIKPEVFFKKNDFSEKKWNWDKEKS